jgi:hypothetical protein
LNRLALVVVAAPLLPVAWLFGVFAGVPTTWIDWVDSWRYSWKMAAYTPNVALKSADEGGVS